MHQEKNTILEMIEDLLLYTCKILEESESLEPGLKRGGGGNINNEF